MARDCNSVSWFRKFGAAIRPCVFLCSWAVSTRLASAQVDQGAISGIVQDATGAVVAGAEVTLVNTDQGLILNVTTNTNGEYTFSPVRIGNYTMTIVKLKASQRPPRQI